MNWLIDLFAAYDVDPRSFAIGVLFGGIAACLGYAIGKVVEPKASRPHRESMSERHARLDAEAAYFIPKSRALSSSRKPGRGRS